MSENRGGTRGGPITKPNGGRKSTSRKTAEGRSGSQEQRKAFGAIRRITAIIGRGFVRKSQYHNRRRIERDERSGRNCESEGDPGTQWPKSARQFWALQSDPVHNCSLVGRRYRLRRGSDFTLPTATDCAISLVRDSTRQMTRCLYRR